MLNLEGVSKSYNGVEAVRDLSLEVGAGSIFGLLGPNGAGKTTTIRMIMRIILPDRGRITLSGNEIDETVRDRVGYLPEERGLYRKMKVKEMLGFLGEIKGLARKDATDRGLRWLERFDLGDWSEKKVEELSKGMQQKLQFISTILHEPEMVILDEPFSGLDPINTELLKEIMLEMSREGRTIIFSTHMMEQVELLCESICLIDKGAKILEGRVAEIKDRYGRDTIRLRFDGPPPELDRIPGVEEATRYGNESRIKLGPEADPQVVLRALVAEAKLTHFEIMTPSVHEIFIERVGGERRK